MSHVSRKGKSHAQPLRNSDSTPVIKQERQKGVGKLEPTVGDLRFKSTTTLDAPPAAKVALDGQLPIEQRQAPKTEGAEPTTLQAAGTAKKQPLDPNVGLMGAAGDAQRAVLRAMTPQQRTEALAKMDPKERMLLIGASALRADVHTVGEAFAVDWSKTRPPHDKTFSMNTFWQMSVAAKRVYEPLPPQGSTEVTPAVADLVKAGYQVHFLGTDKTSTQGFVAVRGEEVLITMRGTEPGKLNDLAVDALITPSFQKEFGSFPAAGHGGFHLGVEEVWGGKGGVAEILAQAKAALPPGKQLSVDVAGHSLGAALATHLAARIDHQKLGDVVGVWAFESPRNLNFAAQSHYDSRLHDVTYRTQRSSDLVANVPTVGWQHVGRHIYFDRLGTMHLEPPIKTVLQDGAAAMKEAAQHRFLPERNGEPQIIWDHSIDGLAKVIHLNLNTPVELG